MFRVLFLCSLIGLLAAFAAAEDLVLRKDRPQKLLVLTNGQVFGGQLIPRQQGGYDVILPSGRMFVSGDRIRFLATSMQDAYEKMSDSLQHRTPANHIEMARWCHSNGLSSAARRELLDALHLDPDHSLARTMLEGLTRQAKRAESNAQSAQEILATMSAQQMGVADRRSLGGLPVHTARAFTVRIQTLLSNNCGNAKCHSGGRSSFQFTNTRRSSSVVIAEQNLASILKQIDLSEPQQSPLLVKAASMHGGARSPLFPGRSGREQMRMLRDWVNEVSSELNPSSGQPLLKPQEGESRALETDQQDQSQALEQANYESDLSSAIPVDGIKIQQRTKTETDGQFGKAAREAIRDNPFDPMIFNRRYHGQTRSSR